MSQSPYLQRVYPHLEEIGTIEQQLRRYRVEYEDEDRFDSYATGQLLEVAEDLLDQCRFLEGKVEVRNREITNLKRQLKEDVAKLQLQVQEQEKELQLRDNQIKNLTEILLANGLKVEPELSKGDSVPDGADSKKAVNDKTGSKEVVNNEKDGSAANVEENGSDSTITTRNSTPTRKRFCPWT